MGVIIINALMGTVNVLVVVKAGMLVVPVAANPMAVLLLSQAKVVPATGPVIGVDGAAAPLQ